MQPEGNIPKTVYDSIHEFENSYIFIRKRVQENKGKLCCDKCGNPFPVNHPSYIVVLKETEELICHPCSYLRTGYNPHAKAKEQAEEKRKLIDQQKAARIKEAQEKEAAKKSKAERKNKKQQAIDNSPKLF